jgi:protein-S-isoprenylcysteine O-methyltransferase Ste14
MRDTLKTDKSGIEKLRKPVSFGIAAVLLVLLVITKPARFGSVPYEILEQLGFILVFVAVLGRIWCTLYIAGRKSRELCTVGPYEVCRNPLYLFSLIGLVGICFAAENTLLALLSAAVYLLYYHGVIRGEERRLAAIFGADFERYVASTPRFWPRLRIPRNSDNLLVNSRIFTRSLLEVIWFLLAINFVEIIERVKLSEVFSSIILPL